MQVSGKQKDYYRILQVSSDCDAKQLEASYKRLAKEYHPDHSTTADIAKFKELTAAYRRLRNPQRRAEYDQANPHLFRVARDMQLTGEGLDHATVANDAMVHETILLHLYNLRRQNVDGAGAGDWQLIDMLGCSDKNLQFHTWYLKAKGYITINEEGTWEITIAGVEHTIETMRTRQETAPLLIKAQRLMPDEPEDDRDENVA